MLQHSSGAATGGAACISKSEVRRGQKRTFVHARSPPFVWNNGTKATGRTTWRSRGGMADVGGQEGEDPLGLVVVRASGRLGRQLYEQQHRQQHRRQL